MTIKFTHPKHLWYAKKYSVTNDSIYIYIKVLPFVTNKWENSHDIKSSLKENIGRGRANFIFFFLRNIRYLYIFFSKTFNDCVPLDLQKYFIITKLHLHLIYNKKYEIKSFEPKYFALRSVFLYFIEIDVKKPYF